MAGYRRSRGPSGRRSPGGTAAPRAPWHPRPDGSPRPDDHGLASAQDVPAVGKSKPEAPVVLEAGAPAYALVKLSDGGTDEDNEPVSAFSLMLEGDATVIDVTAPGSGGIAVNPAKARTGHWTYELRNGADDF